MSTVWRQKAFTKLLWLCYKICYRQGTTNSVADTLSRRALLKLRLCLSPFVNLLGLRIPERATLTISRCKSYGTINSFNAVIQSRDLLYLMCYCTSAIVCGWGDHLQFNNTSSTCSMIVPLAATPDSLSPTCVYVACSPG